MSSVVKICVSFLVLAFLSLIIILDYRDFVVYHADFKLQSNILQYFEKHFYIWSPISGAVNIDGVMRFFARLPMYFSVVAGGGNVALSYFYILHCVGFTIFSFRFFAVHFLKINRLKLVYFFAVIFALSPAFLGNFSKIGLVYSAVSVLLMLAIAKLMIEREKPYYLLFIALVVLLSAIHPFTLLINILVTGVYIIFKCVESPHFIKRNIFKILGWITVCFVLFFYIMLPVVSIGSISKTQLSSALGDEPGNLILTSVAKTQGLSEAYTLSKGVFLDYDFYNDLTKLVFFVATYGLLLIIFTLFFIVSRRIPPTLRTTYFLSSLCFVFLLFLSTGDEYLIGEIINESLTNSPVGWFFRSPLKWQLYIPILFGILLLIGYAQYSQIRKSKRGSGWILILIGIFSYLSIAYISFDISKKLLLPEKIQWNSDLVTENSKALFIFDDSCNALSKVSPDLLDEAVYYFQLNNVSLTRLDDERLFGELWLYNHFDLAITCDDNIETINDRFALEDSLDQRVFLYRSVQNVDYIKPLSSLIEMNFVDSLNDKNDFVVTELNENFDIILTDDQIDVPTISLQEIFEKKNVEELIQGNIIDSEIDREKADKIYVISDSGNTDLTVDGIDVFDDGAISAGESYYEVNPETLEVDDFIFESGDPKFESRNLIEDGSFENGIWDREVENCHNYDDNPIIDLRIVDDSTDGSKSLELSSTRHRACASSDDFEVGQGKEYILEFDFKSANASSVGFNISFDDDDKTNITEKVLVKSEDWSSNEFRFAPPAGASKGRLTVYSFPKNERDNIITQYDDLKLVELPNLGNTYYVVSESTVETAEPENVDFEIINPTKKLVTVRGATKPFYLTMSESYHDKWQLHLDNREVRGLFDAWVPFVSPDKVADDQHFKYMTFLSGWYVDPKDLCFGQTETDGEIVLKVRDADQVFSEGDLREGCTINEDGSYDIDMVIEFFPQRWFYLGLLISGTTFLGMIGYLTHDWFRRRRLKH